MSNGIYLIGRGKVRKDRIAVAQEALRGVIASVRTNNPGVVLYEHTIDAATGAWAGIEKYANDKALKAHLTDPVVGEGLRRFMADLEPEGIVVIGKVDAEARTMMAAFQPTYLGSSLGFARASLIA